MVDRASHGPGPRFIFLGTTLEIVTSLGDGTYFLRVSIPFDLADLGAADPLSADLLYFDGVTWRLAVEGNTVSSPGHAGPIGDRAAVSGSSIPTLSSELGDYGVFWNSSLGQGFVWANVDHTTPFAVGVPIGVPFIRGDANADGLFDIADAIVTLDFLFGAVPSSCVVALDANDDEAVDIGDAIFTLNTLFSGAPSPAAPFPACGLDPTEGSLTCDDFAACL